MQQKTSRKPPRVTEGATRRKTLLQTGSQGTAKVPCKWGWDFDKLPFVARDPNGQTPTAFPGLEMRVE